MSNEERYAAVVFTQSSFGEGLYGIFDRNSGEIAGSGRDHRDAREWTDRLNMGSASKSDLFWRRPDGAAIRGELGPVPKRIAPPEYKLRDEGGDPLLVKARGQGEGAYVKTRSYGVYVAPDKAVEVANAILEAAGLDARVEEV